MHDVVVTGSREGSELVITSKTIAGICFVLGGLSVALWSAIDHVSGDISVFSRSTFLNYDDVFFIFLLSCLTIVILPLNVGTAFLSLSAVSWCSGISAKFGSLIPALEIIIGTKIIIGNESKESDISALRKIFVSISPLYIASPGITQAVFILSMFCLSDPSSEGPAIQEVVMITPLFGFLAVFSLLPSIYLFVTGFCSYVAFVDSSNYCFKGLSILYIMMMSGLFLDDYSSTFAVCCVVLVLASGRVAIGRITGNEMKLILVWLGLRQVLLPSSGIMIVFGPVSSLAKFVVSTSFVLICVYVFSWFLERYVIPRVYFAETSIRNILSTFALVSALSRDIGNGSVEYSIALTTFAGVVFSMFTRRQTLRSELGIGAVICLILIFSAICGLSPKASNYRLTRWQGLHIRDQRAEYCKLGLKPDSSWYHSPYPSKVAHASMNGFTVAQPISFHACSSKVSKWNNLSVIVAGDSVGRFIFFGLVNNLVDESYGFPRAAFHGSINATSALKFVWSPFAENLENATSQVATDVLIVSIGLWDKLWKRDPLLYAETIKQFVRNLGASPKPPFLIWIEMTPTVKTNLIGEEKIAYLDEQNAEEWRILAGEALGQYKSRHLLISTKDVLRERQSHDGVHYDLDSYMAIAKKLLLTAYIDDL